jgi:hypothetical protein
VILGRGEQSSRLRCGHRSGRPPGLALGRLHERRDILAHVIVSLGGRIARTSTLCVLAIVLVDRVWASLLSGPEQVHMRPDGLVRQPVQRLGRPVIHSLGHRVGSRRLQPSIRLGLELLQLLPGLGLGASGDLPPDARTVRPPAERDGTDPGAVDRIAVDRTFAVATAQ